MSAYPAFQTLILVRDMGGHGADPLRGQVHIHGLLKLWVQDPSWYRRQLGHLGPYHIELCATNPHLWRGKVHLVVFRTFHREARICSQNQANLRYSSVRIQITLPETNIQVQWKCSPHSSKPPTYPSVALDWAELQVLWQGGVLAGEQDGNTREPLPH